MAPSEEQRLALGRLHPHGPAHCLGIVIEAGEHRVSWTGSRPAGAGCDRWGFDFLRQSFQSSKVLRLGLSGRWRLAFPAVGAPVFGYGGHGAFDAPGANKGALVGLGLEEHFSVLGSGPTESADDVGHGFSFSPGDPGQDQKLVRGRESNPNLRLGRSQWSGALPLSYPLMDRFS